jgi:hypothetical protein
MPSAALAQDCPLYDELMILPENLEGSGRTG